MAQGRRQPLSQVFCPHASACRPGLFAPVASQRWPAFPLATTSPPHNKPLTWHETGQSPARVREGTRSGRRDGAAKKAGRKDANYSPRDSGVLERGQGDKAAAGEGELARGGGAGRHDERV